MSILWTEKYRPTDLSHVALAPDIRLVLEGFMDEEEIPHLLFVGPAGCGKTTVAKIIQENLDCMVLTLNASAERGIDTIRDKVGLFVKGRMRGRWNIVFLDEADALTTDAQTALRNMMETYAGRARFILTANYPHKIIDPIKSRCQYLALGEIPVKERFKVLSRVLGSEEIEVDDPQIILGYAERYTDMRRMLNAAQRSIMENGGELLSVSGTDVQGENLFNVVKSADWELCLEYARDRAFDCRAGLTDLFWAIPDKFDYAASWRAKVGKAVHESGYTPDPVILFLATCAELIGEADG